jgi:hypothetical protein
VAEEAIGRGFGPPRLAGAQASPVSNCGAGQSLQSVATAIVSLGGNSPFIPQAHRRPVNIGFQRGQSSEAQPSDLMFSNTNSGSWAAGRRHEWQKDVRAQRGTRSAHVCIGRLEEVLERLRASRGRMARKENKAGATGRQYRLRDLSPPDRLTPPPGSTRSTVSDKFPWRPGGHAVDALGAPQIKGRPRRQRVQRAWLPYSER